MPQLVRRQEYHCLAMTWNVNEQRPESSEAFTALTRAAGDAHVVAVGLQEIEMGGGSVAMAAAKDAIARGMLVRMLSLEQVMGRCRACDMQASAVSTDILADEFSSHHVRRLLTASIL